MNDDKRAAFLATLPEEERARLSKKEQRFELEQRRRRAQQDREDAERKAEEAAAEAINMVRVALGPEFSKFIELAQKADRTWREWIRNGGEKPEREEIWLPAKAGVELPEPSPFTSSPRVARSRSAWPSS
jgi:hypothetical protein